MSPDVVTLGETMILLVAEQAGSLREATTFRRHIAGAESNVAVGLCRLGHTAGWISRVGDDEFGRAILFRLRGEGVDLSRVAIDTEAPTGVFFRERREVGRSRCSTTAAGRRRAASHRPILTVVHPAGPLSPPDRDHARPVHIVS